MSRDEIIETVAEFFGIDIDDISKDDDGHYDIRNDYDFQAGCSLGSGGKWLNLANVVRCIEENFNC